MRPGRKDTSRTHARRVLSQLEKELEALEVLQASRSTSRAGTMDRMQKDESTILGQSAYAASQPAGPASC